MVGIDRCGIEMKCEKCKKLMKKNSVRYNLVKNVFRGHYSYYRFCSAKCVMDFTKSQIKLAHKRFRMNEAEN